MREFGIALAILSAVAAPIYGQAAVAKPSSVSGGVPHAETVVVFPFENVANDAAKDWLGEGLSELTTDSMVGHGPVVFTRDERLAALEKLGLPTYSRFSRATMIKIAGEIDADYVVFGEFTPDGTAAACERARAARQPAETFRAIFRVGQHGFNRGNRSASFLAHFVRDSKFACGGRALRCFFGGGVASHESDSARSPGLAGIFCARIAGGRRRDALAGFAGSIAAGFELG